MKCNGAACIAESRRFASVEAMPWRWPSNVKKIARNPPRCQVSLIFGDLSCFCGTFLLDGVAFES
jgi:hypothetical protein